MGTILVRKRADGTTRFTAQVRKKQAGRTVFSAAQTFSTEKAARAWTKKVKKALAEGKCHRRTPVAPVDTLSGVLKRYLDDTKDTIGETKAGCLRFIRDHEIGEMECHLITSVELIDLARSLSRRTSPTTANNYLQHLSAVFDIASVAYKAPLDYNEIDAAKRAARKLGLIAKSGTRDRRLELHEADALMNHFEAQARRSNAAPMYKIVPFAVASTRRLSEITRLRWKDLDKESGTILVRDMKHPGEKTGNNVRVILPKEALEIIETMPRVCEHIFPYNPDTISTNFTRACANLDVEDLRFHDLRHEGISRQFEMGLNIAEAKSISGHRTLASLGKYEHYRAKEDKFTSWSGWSIALTPEPEWRVKANLERRRRRAARAAAREKRKKKQAA